MTRDEQDRYMIERHQIPPEQQDRFCGHTHPAGGLILDRDLFTAFGVMLALFSIPVLVAWLVC